MSSWRLQKQTSSIERMLRREVSGSITNGGAGREMLTGDKHWFASPDGSNANPGTREKPFADPVYAYDLALRTLDLGGYTVTVNLLGDFANVAWRFADPLVGGGPRSFHIRGQGPGTVVRGRPGGLAVSAWDFAGIQVSNLTMAPGPGGYGFTVGAACGTIYVDDADGHTAGAHVMFNGCGTGCNIVVTNFRLTAAGPAINYVAVSEDHSNIILRGQWVMNGGPAFNVAFCQSDLTGLIDATGFSCTGACTGPRFNALAPGVVFTGVGSSPPNFFPGSSPGIGSNPWYQ
jgi:hypothetical protein